MDKLKSNIGVIMVILGLVGSTGTFYSKFAKMELIVNQLEEASKSIDIASVKLVESNRNAIETNGFSIVDNTQIIAEIKANADKEISILQKEIQILKLNISEIKEANKNPLN